MDKAELLTLLTPEGLRLIDEIDPTAAAADVVAAVSRLRSQGHSPELVAAALTQARLRRKATAKFGEFASRMLFTEAGLEQATRLSVASLHAGRIARAGFSSVADLGCGIGADSLALAGIGLTVTAVEHDEVTATLASYNLAPFESARVVHQDAESFDVNHVEAVYLDPARRTSGHTNTSRLTRPEDYTPSLVFAWSLAAQKPTGVKLGPGFDHTLIPDDCEAQWVSVDGSVVELGLWFGALARDGIRRSAVVMHRDGTHEISGPGNSEDVDVRELGEYLYEPDGAVIRARLIGDLARDLGAGMVSDRIAYLTGDTDVSSPFATRFRVIERMPFDERAIKRRLRENGVGALEVKKRGVDIDPAQFRKRMSLAGSATATIVLTRVGGRHAALLVERA
ncbi:50S ribosomal protein L11 methyltransferase [Okibacterium endophyticum]